MPFWKKADSQIHADCFFFCSTIDVKGKKKSYMELRTFLKKKKQNKTKQKQNKTKNKNNMLCNSMIIN